MAKEKRARGDTLPKKERKPVKAIFIDAITEEVKEITLKDGGSFREIYPLMNMPGLRPVDDINSVRIDLDGHYIYVDGEGLLKDPTYFILWKNYSNALAGHAVIVRIDDEGDTVDATINVATVKRHLKFVKLKMHGFVTKSESVIMFGRPGTRITNSPVLTERREPGSGKALDLDEIAKHMGVPPGTLEWTTMPEVDDDPGDREGDVEDIH